LLINQDPVIELARLFWVHWSTLAQQQLYCIWACLL